MGSASLIDLLHGGAIPVECAIHERRNHGRLITPRFFHSAVPESPLVATNKNRSIAYILLAYILLAARLRSCFRLSTLCFDYGETSLRID